MHEVWQISNETDFLVSKVLFSKHQYYPLEYNSLGQLHTNGDVVPTFSSSAASLQPVWPSTVKTDDLAKSGEIVNEFLVKLCLLALFLKICIGLTSSIKGRL